MWALTNDVLQGLGTSLRNHAVDQQESSLKVSRHNFRMTAMLQMVQVDAAIEMGKLFYKNYYRMETPLSGTASWLLYGVTWIPALVGYEAAYSDKSTLKGRVVYWLHDNMSTFCLISNCISTIGLIAIGSYALGISSLVGLSYGVLCSRNIVPASCRNFGDPATQIITRLSIVLFGSTLARVFVAVDVAINVATYVQKFFGTDLVQLQGKLMNDPRYRRDIPPTSLTPSAILALLNSKNPLSIIEINYGHLNEIALELPKEKCDFVDTILTQFDKHVVNEGDTLERLAYRLSSDPRWKTEHVKTHPLKKGKNYNEDLIPYLRDRLKGLLEGVRDKNLKNGAIKDYKKFQNYLTLIAHKMKTDQKLNKTDLSNYLMRLAIDGGGYCTAGAVKAIEDGYNEFVFDPVIYPKEWIYFVLQQQRRRIAERLVIALTNSQPQLKLMKDGMGGDDDLHVNNVFMSIFDKLFGLNSPSIDQDNMVETKGATDQIFMNILVSQGIGEVFHDGMPIPMLGIDLHWSKKVERRYNDFSKTAKKGAKKGKFRNWLVENYQEGNLISNDNLHQSAKKYVNEVKNNHNKIESKIKSWLPNFVATRHPDLISYLSWDINVVNEEIYLDPYSKENILKEMQQASTMMSTEHDRKIRDIFMEELSKVQGINEQHRTEYGDESYLDTIKGKIDYDSILVDKIKCGENKYIYQWKKVYLCMLLIQLGVFNIKNGSVVEKETSWETIINHDKMKGDNDY